MAVTTRGFKEFNAMDWEVFAGCEPFSDGSDPVTAETTIEDGVPALVIIDGHGVYMAADGRVDETAELSPVLALALRKAVLA